MRLSNYMGFFYKPSNTGQPIVRKMTKSQNKLLLIPEIFAVSKERCIFKTMALILMQKDSTLFISANNALHGILQCNRWPSTD